MDEQKQELTTEQLNVKKAQRNGITILLAIFGIIVLIVAIVPDAKKETPVTNIEEPTSSNSPAITTDADSLLNTKNYSADALSELLLYKEYSDEEIDQELSNIDFQEIACKQAKLYYNEIPSLTWQVLDELLTLDGFTESDIDFAIDQLGVEWKNRFTVVNEPYQTIVDGESKIYSGRTFKSNITGYNEGTVVLYEFPNNQVDEMMDFISNAIDDYNNNLIDEEDVEEEMVQEQKEEIKEEPTEEVINDLQPTIGESNALGKAKQYLKVMAFSRQGLINQLVQGDKFSVEDATYAVNNINADWMEQAVKSAKNYLDAMSFSRDGLINQLVQGSLFSVEEATYGAEQNGY